MKLDQDTQRNVNLWLEGDYDDETKNEIRQLLQEDPQKVIDAFYTTLSFGTGGLRGIMGLGTNRMNPYTVRAATQGVANYLKKTKKKDLSFFIGYDSRINSREFAEEVAKVLAGNGIQVYLCKELRPTPYVSFGCRMKQCDGAIMITASHNPPEYNGYKVYWDDGGQVLPPHDQGIIDEVQKILSPGMVKSVESITHELITEVGEEVDQAYKSALSSLQLYPKENKKHGNELKIVYSSLHGTGVTMIPQVLKDWGFTDVVLVEEQCKIDGQFPTVESPNPEEKSALEMGINLMNECSADLLIATDPDADRVGVAVKHRNDVHLLTGNQIACICLEFICEALTKQCRMPEKAAFVKTIGTSELFRAIVDHYGKTCFNTLTGFKYIAELIEKWDHDPEGYQFVFGGEESYGYLLGTHCHDKDAVISSALICEVALHAKRQGKTLIDLLNDLFMKYGVFVEKLVSLKFPESKAGKEQMAKGIEKLRKNPPESFQGIVVTSIEDYLTSKKKVFSTGETIKLTLPRSNVLLFWLADGSKIMIRPSGTEPKVKIYCGVTCRRKQSADCEEYANELIEEMKKALEN